MSAKAVDILWKEHVREALPNPNFLRITEMVCKLLKAPFSSLTLPDGQNAIVHSGQQADPRQVLLGATLCERCYTLGSSQVFEDITAEPELRARPLAQELKARAYAGFPIRLEGTSVLGVLCAIDFVPRVWTDEELGILEDMARIIGSEFEARRQAAQLQYERLIMDCVFESMSDGLVIVDEEGNYIRRNQPYRRSLGSGRTSARQELAEDMEVLDDQGQALTIEQTPLFRAFSSHEIVEQDILLRTPDRPEGRWVSLRANPVRTRAGDFLGAVAVARDITATKLKEEELKALALIDSLTGLHNRRALMTLSRQILSYCDRENRVAQVFFFDLDGLKDVNDTLGHSAGDTYLREFADILRATFRGSDIVSRLGGDEFVVLAVGEAGPAQARLQAQLEEHNQQRPGAPPLRVSQGLVTYQPRSKRRLEDIVEEADQLMYASKQQRKAEGMPIEAGKEFR